MYKSVKDIVDDNNYPFTKGQLDFHLVNRNENGLSIAVRKIGKRLLIRMDLFDKWIESYQEKKN